MPIASRRLDREARVTQEKNHSQTHSPEDYRASPVRSHPNGQGKAMECGPVAVFACCAQALGLAITRKGTQLRNLPRKGQENRP